MFTTQHYRALAELISDHDVEPANVIPGQTENGLSYERRKAFAVGAAYMRFLIATDLVGLFSADNPNFDADKFLAAAGITREQWEVM